MTRLECECLDCDWDGFTDDCVTEDEDGFDSTLQCPLCRAAVQVYLPEKASGCSGGKCEVKNGEQLYCAKHWNELPEKASGDQS